MRACAFASLCPCVSFPVIYVLVCLYGRFSACLSACMFVCSYRCIFMYMFVFVFLWWSACDLVCRCACVFVSVCACELSCVFVCRRLCAAHACAFVRLIMLAVPYDSRAITRAHCKNHTGKTQDPTHPLVYFLGSSETRRSFRNLDSHFWQ